MVSESELTFENDLAWILGYALHWDFNDTRESVPQESYITGKLYLGKISYL